MTDNPNPPVVPSDANTDCVGPTSATAGKASSCDGCPNQSSCASGAMNSPEALAKAAAEARQLQECIGNVVSHTILVLSGKGGVGKSTVAAQTALTLAAQGYAVGLLDVDLCGPSAPRMVLGPAAATQTVVTAASGLWRPVYTTPMATATAAAATANDTTNATADTPTANTNTAAPLAVMSISFLLPDHDQAVIWRGPRKNALIQQFLTKVDWTGETDGLDYLIVDTPPGTSDEHISTVQYLQQQTSTTTTKDGTAHHDGVSGAIVVTTPEEASLADVRKELSFCRKTNVPVLAVVENMGSLTTPVDQLVYATADGTDATAAVRALLEQHLPDVATATAKVFTVTPGGAEAMAADYGCPFWGGLPLDPDLLQACERGECLAVTHPDSAAARKLTQWCERLVQARPVDMVHPEDGENDNDGGEDEDAMVS